MIEIGVIVIFIGAISMIVDNSIDYLATVTVKELEKNLENISPIQIAEYWDVSIGELEKKGIVYKRAALLIKRKL